MSFILVFAVALIYGGNDAAPTYCESNGTTVHIKEIFIGRCIDYIEKINPGPFCGHNSTDCTDLWEDFSSDLQYHSSCNTTPGMYNAFLENANHEIPRGKSMFWQGVKGFVQELTYLGKRYFSLEDTLYGYITNGLNWCGALNGSGWNYTACPGWDDCNKKGPLRSWWSSASKQFAHSASGTIQVMINGSRTPPYRPHGIFGTIELPGLNKNLVDKITVLVVHDLDLTAVENCDGTSIKQMLEAIRSRGFDVNCIDDPAWVRFYMCVDNTNNSICKFYNASLRPTLTTLTLWLLVSISSYYIILR